jgi:transposase
VAALPGRGGRIRYLDAAAQTWLVAQVEQAPDQTLAELRTAWMTAGGRPVCLPMLWRVLDEHGLPAQKKACTLPSGIVNASTPCASSM